MFVNKKVDIDLTLGEEILVYKLVKIIFYSKLIYWKL